MIFWHRQLRWDSFSPIIRQIWPIYAANKDTYHQQSAELSDVYRPLLPMIETGTKILQCSRPSTQLIPFPPKKLKQFQSFFRPPPINTSPSLQAACGLRVTCDLWLVTCDLWLVTCDLWLVTCDLDLGRGRGEGDEICVLVCPAARRALLL
jgi:hypothetical protein